MSTPLTTLNFAAQLQTGAQFRMPLNVSFKSMLDRINFNAAHHQGNWSDKDNLRRANEVSIGCAEVVPGEFPEAVKAATTELFLRFGTLPKVCESSA